MANLRFVFAVLTCSCIFHGVLGRIDDGQILTTLFKNYDNKIRPHGLNGSDGTLVTINMYIRDIEQIAERNMEYSVQLTFRQEWNDPRLAYQHIDARGPYLTLTESKRIWMPDLFFSNEKRGHIHDIVMPNVYVRIFPDGGVLYSIRISLTLSCPMVFKLFPFDKQTCSIRMASYGYTSDDIIFQWKKNDPVQMTPNSLHLPNFALTNFTTQHCDSHTNTGIYSCLRLDLIFARDIAYYFLQIFIPCVSLVIMAWLSFWLSKVEVVGRLLLTVITYLIMAIGISLMNVVMPQVSYTKAIDVWTGVCLTFVFFALIEFVIVNFLHRREERSPGIELKDGQHLRQKFSNWAMSEKVDAICRVAYPCAFGVFVCLYAAAFYTPSNRK